MQDTTVIVRWVCKKYVLNVYNESKDKDALYVFFPPVGKPGHEVYLEGSKAFGSLMPVLDLLEPGKLSFAPIDAVKQWELSADEFEAITGIKPERQHDVLDDR